MKRDIPSGRWAGKHELKKPICIPDVALCRRNHSKSRILEKLITSSFSSIYSSSWVQQSTTSPVSSPDPGSYWRQRQPVISRCINSRAHVYRDLLALKLPEENLTRFSSLNTSVGWNSSFLKFLATARSVLHLQFTGGCCLRVSWRFNTYVQTHVPQLRSTERDQEEEDWLLLRVHPQAETLFLITREGISLVKIPPKSQCLILLHSSMWAQLSVTAVRWLPDDRSLKQQHWLPIPILASYENEEIVSNQHPPPKKKRQSYII